MTDKRFVASWMLRGLGGLVNLITRADSDSLFEEPGEFEVIEAMASQLLAIVRNRKERLEKK